MSRLDSLAIKDNLLTNIARGYKDNKYVGENIFPFVQMDKETGKYYIFNDEQFKHYSVKRAPGTQSQRVTTELGTTDTYKLEQYSLEEAIDDREQAESDVLNLEQHITNMMSKRQLHALEMEQASVATNLANYNSSNKVTLSDDFYNEAAIDFVIEIEKKKDIIKSSIAENPNTILLPEKVWNFFKTHPILKSYLVNDSTKKILVAPEEFGKLLGFQTVLIASALNKVSTGLEEVWGNNIWLGYVAPRPSALSASEKEPSFGYTLRKKGSPLIDKYRDETIQSNIIRSNDNYQVKIVGQNAGYLIKNPIDPAVYSA